MQAAVTTVRGRCCCGKSGSSAPNRRPVAYLFLFSMLMMSSLESDLNYKNTTAEQVIAVGQKLAQVVKLGMDGKMLPPPLPQ